MYVKDGSFATIIVDDKWSNGSFVVGKWQWHIMNDDRIQSKHLTFNNNHRHPQICVSECGTMKINKYHTHIIMFCSDLLYSVI